MTDWQITEFYQPAAALWGRIRLRDQPWETSRYSNSWYAGRMPGRLPKEQH
jgi:hypothetical protein